MSRVPWWAWAAGAALILYLFYQHSKANSTAQTNELKVLHGQLGTAGMATGFWPVQDTLSIEQLQQLQSTIYSQENTPQYMNARLSQQQLQSDIQALVADLPQFWPVAVTATAPTTTNGSSAPQS